MLKLLRGADLIGTIDDINYDWPWMIGRIVLTESANQYKELFASVGEDQRNSGRHSYDESIFQGWYTESENGNRELIRFPGFYAGGEIRWRTQPPQIVSNNSTATCQKCSNNFLQDTGSGI